jgi:L-histidine Nalpha-methyltransferase
MLDSAEQATHLSQRLSFARVRIARPVPSLHEDVIEGLLRRPRQIPPKYFYDARGSWLFEQICLTPEYYPTRVEAALLRQYAPEIVRAVQPQHIVELGSGTARKTRILLDAVERETGAGSFWPMDVCEEALLDSARELSGAYPWLRVRALIGDYHGGLEHLPLPAQGTRLFLFLGGTIGNFGHEEALVLLRDLAAQMRPGDAFLLGADRVKDPAVLHAAYNDAAGITAQFNLNMLEVVNREIGADFLLDAFEHAARYDEREAQIEMHLVARVRQTVRLRLLGERIEIEAGERILTEISRKFTVGGLAALLAEAGMRVDAHLEAPGGSYSLLLARLTHQPRQDRNRPR